jgi:hypothetical protein
LGRSRIGGSLDVNRAGEALSRPGIDTRTWVSLAVVNKVVVDADHGVFADVTLLPSEVPETARVATLYAGGGFGLYLPLEVGDEVVVIAPSGEPDEGLVVMPRLWCNADKPPADAASKPTDLLLVAKEGATVRIVTGGSGNVVIEPRGSGEVRLGAEDAPHPACRGDNLQTTLNALIDVFNSHLHSMGTTNGPTGGPISVQLPNPSPPPAFLPPIPTSAGSSGAGDLSPNVKVK